MGAGLVLEGELHRGHHGAAGEVDFALLGLGDEVDPSAPAIAELAAQLAREATGRLAWSSPDVRALFAAAQGEMRWGGRS